MADKKKMSVAEILAAARKMDSADQSAASSQQAQQDSAETEASAATAASSAPVAKSASAPAAATTASPKASAPKKAGGGERPSVAEMMAMARAEKQAAPAEKKTSPKPSAKPAAAKADAAPKAAPKSPAAPKKDAPRGPLDTASILAAARKADKPGPMSKAEAAKLKSPAAAPAAPAKKKVEVPPMPAKPAYVQRPSAPPKPSAKPARASAAEEADRRGFLMLGFAGLAGVGALWLLATARFMYPNVLREPPSRFRVGFPGDFTPGVVETKFKAQFGVWVVNTDYNGEPQLFALKSVCTHLGCTPNWLEAEQKFKCPCHGSGFYKDGINFEGPAPRPLERYAIRVADDGQVEIDKSRTFQEEMGAWSDPASYIPV